MASANQVTIAQFLSGKGLSPGAISGIEGNLEVESNFDPTASNPQEGAIGIAQWERGRRTALQAYASSQGTTETNLDTQLNFLWSELSGPYSSVLQALEGPDANDPVAAATVFQQSYEGSSPDSLPTRVTDAQTIYNSSTSGTSTGKIDTTLKSPGDIASDALSGVGGAIQDVLKWLAAPLENAGLVIGGIIVIIIGLVLLAKNAESDDKSNTASSVPSGGESEGADTAEDALAGG